MPRPGPQGFVVSLARPGRNVTGLSNVRPETIGKLLQSLKDIVPKASRLGVLSLPNAAHASREGTKVAARALGLQLEVSEARNPEALPRVFETARKARLDGLVVLGLQYRERIVELAAQYHVPAVYQFREFVDAGGLRSYGANLVAQYHRAATYVDISKHVGRVKSERVLA